MSQELYNRMNTNKISVEIIISNTYLNFEQTPESVEEEIHAWPPFYYKWEGTYYTYIIRLHVNFYADHALHEHIFFMNFYEHFEKHNSFNGHVLN